VYSAPFSVVRRIWVSFAMGRWHIENWPHRPVYIMASYRMVGREAGHPAVW